jgi:hypothetical protein
MMAEFKNQNQQGQYRPESAKREQESASKAGKSAHEQRERDRASQADKSHQDNARGDRNPGNFQQDQKRGGER